MEVLTVEHRVLDQPRMGVEKIEIECVRKRVGEREVSNVSERVCLVMLWKSLCIWDCA